MDRRRRRLVSNNDKNKKLIIIIDLWQKAVEEIEETLPDYVDIRINNIIQILNNIKDNSNYDVYNANYASNKCENNNECRCFKHGRKILDKITNININFIKNINYKKYSHVYVAGLSFDGCVLNRDLGYLKINHKNKYIIRDCCLNENPLRGKLQNDYFKKNNKDVEISDKCPAKWIKNGKIEWNGPYYILKTNESMLNYENFIIKHYNLNIISIEDLQV